ncbi:MAG: universal stress protein, partial [Candidatus Brocadiales bacterium]
MITFKKILCPIDYSDCSAKALKYAAGLALKDSARLYLMHIIDKRIYDYGGPIYEAQPGTDDETIGQLKKKLGESIPKEIKGEIDVETIVTVGVPAQEIVNASNERGVDLIVMGTHGRTGIAHV